MPRDRSVWLVLLVVGLLCAWGAPGFAQEDMDDILGGFDDADEDFEVGDEAVEEADPSRVWRVQGDFGQALSVSLHDHDAPGGTDYSGLQRFRSKLALQLDVDLPRKWKLRASGYGYYDAAYAINGRSDYTDDVLDTHEYDFELTDTYVEGSLQEHVDLKLGRQVVNWGRSESIRVLDVINPLDNREPGLVDIEDIRRPLGMAKLGFFRGPWSLTFLAIPEIRYNQDPGRGSDQFPDFAAAVPRFEGPQALLEVAAYCGALSSEASGICQDFFSLAASTDFDDLGSKTEADFGKSTEFALNLTGVFSGWDVSLQAVSFNDDNAHFELDDQRFEHARLWMVGTGGNYTTGAWLFKAELAFTDGLEFMWTSDEKSRLDFMVGVEYYGIDDVNVVFEVAERHIFDFEPEMELFLDFAQEDTIETALRITMDFMNDQLHFTLFGLVVGEKAQDGSLVRLSVEYEVFDAFSLQGGFLLFQDGDSIFFDGSGDNDRLFAGAKYSF